ncbi:hypothetical protein Goarm_000872, partial [Gossypium armourianum]|nr:hypothetical protein [Gossypium armourianum]
NLLNGLKLVVAETIGYIIEATLVSKLPPKAQDPTPKRRYNKKYCHKERNITFRSLLEVKRYETNGILPMHGKKKKESNDQNESLAPLLLLISRETGELNEELKASTMERTNSENMHMSNLTTLASTAPKDVPINDEAAPIDVSIIDEVALIDVPINDETAMIDVPIIYEASLIDVPITYVENF